MDVGTGAVACFYCEVLGDRFLETAGFDADGVVSNREKRKAVVAGAVGLAGPPLVGPEVGEGNVGVGDDRAGGIGDRSEDVSSGQLREGC